MPTPCNLRVNKYPGSCEKSGREDTIDVYELEQNIHQPIRPETGQASGVRVHSPLRLVAQVDKATPGLCKACCTGENLGDVVLEYWRIDPVQRSEDKYFEITMRQARVVDVRPYMPMSFLPQNETYHHMIQVSFVYEEVEWNWIPDAVITVDKWREPSAG